MEGYQPLFTITPEVLSLAVEIGELIGRISGTAGLSASPVLRRTNRIRSVYSSLAIEQNTLTLDQVTAVLNGKRVIAPPKDIAEREVLIVDPMLATGGSAVAAIDEMKKRGCTNIKLMVLVAVPEGIERVQTAHPDVDIYCGAVDSHLNEHGYIVPGLGDAGDRIFGTK